MANYEAGNLNLIFNAIDNSNVANLDKTINSLSKMATSIKTLAKFSNTTINTANIEKTFNILSKMKFSTTANQQQFAQYINSLSKGISSLSRLPKTFENLNKVDYNKLSTHFNKITTAITPFLDKVNSSQAGLTALASTLTTIGKSGATKASTNGRTSLNSLFNLGKLTSALYIARRIGTTLAKVVQYGSDFNETLNMWQVSMRNSLDLADDFISKMRKAYGISTETLMESQAIYKNMLSQIGQLTEETSYSLSESLTAMMLDYSSLWNVSIESASEKFKAMLAGQIRPIRAVSGISVEEQAIFDIYKSFGGTKTMRQLTQVEKRLLRIYATFSQMQQSGATGDYAKTIEQFANQSRIMTENWKELVTWVGIGARELIDASGVMTYINALLITATEIVKSLVHADGYEAPDFLKGFLGTTEDINEEIDNIQGKLLDFDKFRALEDTQGSSSLGIDQKILDLMASYTSSIGETTYEAQRLADEWLKVLGFTYDAEEEIWVYNGSLTETKDLLSGILEALKLIGSMLVGGLVAKGLIGLVSSLGQGLNLATSLGMTISAIGFGALMYSILNLVTAWDDMSGWERAKHIMIGVAGALMGVAGAIFAVKGALTTGIQLAAWASSLALIGAFVAGAVVSMENATKYANGGTPDKGTLFIAGEAGAEIVSTNASGQTGVANVDQIAQATYRGNMMFWAQARRDLKDIGSVTISADSKGILRVVKNEASKEGLTFAKIN